MLIRRYTAELVESNRWVDQILFYDDEKGSLPFLQLVGTIRRQQFDVVVLTYPRFRLAVMMWLAGIPMRLGTGYRWYSFFFNKRVYEHRKYAERHELEYNLNLLKALGCNVDGIAIKPVLEVQPSAVEKVRMMLNEMGIPKDCRIVILHPGSGGSAREWSPENFGILAQRCAKLPNISVIITGGESEQQLVARVKAIAGEDVKTLVNKLSVKEYTALASLASLLVAHSTGPLHIAAAVGTPVIGLYSQITALSVKRWGPLVDKKVTFTPYNKPSDCTQCDGVKGSRCECMDTILVGEVFEAAKRLLNVQ